MEYGAFLPIPRASEGFHNGNLLDAPNPDTSNNRSVQIQGQLTKNRVSQESKICWPKSP